MGRGCRVSFQMSRRIAITCGRRRRMIRPTILRRACGSQILDDGTRRKDLVVGGIEAGGTKFVCAVGRGPGGCATGRGTGRSSPPVTTRAVSSRGSSSGSLEKQEQQPLAAIGIASFGPVDLAQRLAPIRADHLDAQTGLGKHRPGRADSAGARRHSGRLRYRHERRRTGRVFSGAGRPVSTTSSISRSERASARAEWRADGCCTARPPRDGALADFRGSTAIRSKAACKYHGDCWEGLCSGEAMRQRTGMPRRKAAARPPRVGLRDAVHRLRDRQHRLHAVAATGDRRRQRE